MFSRVMWALEMVASSVSVTVPERTDALGASGSSMAGDEDCWAKRAGAPGEMRRTSAQRSMVCWDRLRRELVVLVTAAACYASQIPVRARKSNGEGLKKSV
jgi:hypothetical protein